MKAIYTVDRDTNRDEDLVTLDEFDKQISSIEDLVKAITAFQIMHPNAIINEEGPELALEDHNLVTKTWYTLIFKSERA